MQDKRVGLDTESAAYTPIHAHRVYVVCFQNIHSRDFSYQIIARKLKQLITNWELKLAKQVEILL